MNLANERRRLRQFDRFVAALQIDFGYETVGSLSFGEVLFSFAIGPIDLLPRWGEKYQRSISVASACALDQGSLAQADETRIAERIWYATVSNRRF